MTILHSEAKAMDTVLNTAQLRYDFCLHKSPVLSVTYEQKWLKESNQDWQDHNTMTSYGVLTLEALFMTEVSDALWILIELKWRSLTAMYNHFLLTVVGYLWKAKLNVINFNSAFQWCWPCRMAFDNGLLPSLIVKECISFESWLHACLVEC